MIGFLFVTMLSTLLAAILSAFIWFERGKFLSAWGAAIPFLFVFAFLCGKEVCRLEDKAILSQGPFLVPGKIISVSGNNLLFLDKADGISKIVYVPNLRLRGAKGE